MGDQKKLILENLLETAASQGASDLHLVAGRYPTLRLDGSLLPLVKEPILTAKDTEEYAFLLANEAQKARFLERGELDFAYTFREKARFRINVYRERGFIAIALRFIPNAIKTLGELGLPATLERFTRHSQGLFLVAGPTGHGKSSTLAGLIDIINHTYNVHIITIEDPIEYLFIADRAIITQREIFEDTKDFFTALTYSFRQDPDVIMVGELRDPETIATAITAAETGHLVFGTLHTNSAAQTIDRIIDSFPPSQQNQIRMQLSTILLGVLSQRLLPRLSGGRLPAIELMIANHAIRNLIRENKTHQIDLVISTSYSEGMISLNRSLVNLVKKREISVEMAQTYSMDEDGMLKLLEE